jgi:hypothetical protein
MIRVLGAAVKLNSASTVFRAQLVVPEQRQLFDYWIEKSRGRSMPRRSDINPTHIPRILSGISLVDVSADKARCRIRLAGTRLREIYDREITGLHIEDLDWGDKHDYWIAAYRRTIEEGKPTQGVIRGPRLHKEHLVQYWLKLPLATESGDVGMLLCYDYFQSASDDISEVALAAMA